MGKAKNSWKANGALSDLGVEASLEVTAFLKEFIKVYGEGMSPRQLGELERVVYSSIPLNFALAINERKMQMGLL